MGEEGRGAQRRLSLLMGRFFTPSITNPNTQTGGSPKAVRTRSHSPVRPSLIGPLSTIRTERDLQGRAVSKHRHPPFRGSIKLVLVVIAVALAPLIVFHFFWQGDGPKLVKGGAALAPGDRLKGGQYVSFCTSIITNPTGCRPKYLLMGRDGSLGLYEGGMSPKAKKLWSAEMATKGNAQSEYEMVYTGSKLFLIRDGKMRWMTPVKSLPKDLKPWPFGP